MNRNKDEITESNYRLVKKEPYPSANGYPGGIIYHFHSDKTNDSYKMFIDDEGDVGLVI